MCRGRSGVERGCDVAENGQNVRDAGSLEGIKEVSGVV